MPVPFITPVVLQYDANKNIVKQMVPRKGCQKRFTTNCFNNVLGLTVSEQGKLEFESDLSKKFTKQLIFLRFYEPVAFAAEPDSHFKQRL